MLSEEISNVRRLVKTDSYQMSFGEIASLYDEHELIINPNFQRLFRWKIGQKSKLIESLLLGIPIPSIFVFEREDSTWELVDGLQRVSTVLEFMGRLRKPEGELALPSVLEATKYLPSLHNTVWERSESIEEPAFKDQVPLDKSEQLAIRRARIGVEILKRPSEDQTKYDLFQRLNAGGTQANPQELRNCIMIMVNSTYFESIKVAAESEAFQTVISLTKDQEERQRHLEWAVRFLVHTLVPYDGKLDVEEFIDEGIIKLSTQGDTATATRLIELTFGLLHGIAGGDAMKRFDSGRHLGKVGLVALEGIAVGIAKNIDRILELPNPKQFVEQKIQEFWTKDEVTSYTTGGLRGTTRIQRTVPFGEQWFRP